jgi:ribonucleoside-diphosphate reductase alpha chain
MEDARQSETLNVEINTEMNNNTINIIETKSSNQITKKENNDRKIYTREEALKSCIEYFKGDTLAAEVWINKYSLKDSAGNIYELNPEEMHRRIAKEFARVEKKYENPISEEEIFNLIKEFKYIIPQGSPMAGIGNDMQYVSLSNCFVIGNNTDSDSYGGILKLDQELVQLMKRRAGVGLDLSFVRPSGSPVKNSALTSTGVVPFMERYSNSTREVAQDGRRGALMESISINHLDAEKFIDAKMDEKKVTGANVSVRISDAFMKAALAGKKFTQQYPVEAENPSLTKEVDAEALWKKIIHNAWKRAEPGILFWDTIIKESVPDCYSEQGFRSTSTNPCGEIVLCPNDSCRLLLLNLFSYVENPFTDKAKYNFTLFKQHVQIAQRLMDDLIDLELEKVDKILEKIANDPEEEEIKRAETNLWKSIKDKCIKGRRTGLGITAEGDMIAALNLTYGTDEANDFSEKIHKTLKLEAYRSSVNMAKERGAFPIYNSTKEENNPFISRIKKQDPELYEDMMKHGRRNIALLTIAPAGSVSVLTQTTSGIEPAFSIYYTRRRKINPNDKNVRVDFVDAVGDSWQEYAVFHHKFLDYLKANNYNVAEVEAMPKEEIEKIIKKSPYHKATSNDVDWVKKVEMQGRIQKHVDHSISVTVNLPNDVSEEIVAKVYEAGWKSGCKGVTVYRDGSRSGVLISSEEKKKEEQNFKENHAPKRPKVLDAQVLRFNNEGQKWIGFIGLLDGRPYEIFTGVSEDFPLSPNVSEGKIKKSKIINKKGEKVSKYDFVFIDKNGEEVLLENLNRAFDKDYWNYAKMISSILRHGMPLPYVVELIESLNLGADLLNTWKNGVIRMIKKYIKDGTKAKDTQCSSCGDPDGLIYQEGCLVCKSCGNSKCG